MITGRCGAATLLCGALLLLANGGATAADTASVADVIERLEKGDFVSNEQALDLAIATLTEAIGRSPNDAEALRGRGVAYNDREDLGKALADFNQALSIDPNYAKAFCDRACVCIEKEYLEKAIADANEAIRIAPENSLGYGVRACAYWGKGEFGKAITDYGKAIDLDPNNALRYQDRGNAYVVSGDLDNAIADYTQGIRLDLKYGLLYMQRGDLYEEKGDLDKAIADYTEAVRLHPTDNWMVQRRAGAYSKRAEKSMVQEDFLLAIADYTQAIQLRTQDTDSDFSRGGLHKKRGRIYRKMGDKAKAKEDFAEAKRLGYAITVEDEETPAQDAVPNAPRPNDAPPAAPKPSHDPGSEVFGPHSLGLGPNDAMQIHFSSSGCFHSLESDLMFTGSRPDAMRTRTEPQTFPLNQYDWWRMRRLLTTLRSGNTSNLCTTSNDITISWFRDKKWTQQEHFADPSNKGRLLGELEWRTISPRKKGKEPEPTIVAKTYAVADLVARRGASGAIEYDFRPLVGLIYALVQSDCWKVDAGGEIEVAVESDSPALSIRQTVEAHQDIARLLAFLRPIAPDAAGNRPAVYYDHAQTAKTIDSLSRKVSLAIDDQPLSRVAKALQEQHKLRVLLGDDLPDSDRVTLHVRDMSLRAAMKLIAETCSLECVMKNGTLLLTTSQEA